MVDFLCLGAAARRLEEDILQRFMESPGAEADRRSALNVDGCPACDTLWAQVMALYSALRSQWADGVPMPASFGADTTAAKRKKCALWRRRTCVSAFQAITTTDLGAFAGSLIPLCFVTLHHSVDAPVIGAALAALGSLTSNASLATGCVIALRRFATVDVDVVVAVSTVLFQAVHATAEHEEVEVVISDEFSEEGGLALLMSALARFSSDADAVQSICTALYYLADDHEAFVEAGAPELLSALLHCHVNSPAVVSIVCSTLGLGIQDSSLSFVRADGIPNLLAALTAHREERILVEEICGVLAIAYRTDGGCGTVIGAAGAALLVSVAIRYSGVRSTACAVLYAIAGAAVCEANQAPLVAVGVIPLAIAAAGRHAAHDADDPSDSVVRAAANVFRELARSADTREVLVAAGVIPVLVGSLPSQYIRKGSWWFPFKAICESLLALAADNDAHRLAVVAAGAIPPMVRALGGTPQMVVKAIANMLCELSKSPAGAAAVVAGGGVVPLLSLLSNPTFTTADISWEPTTTAMRTTLAACIPHGSAEERALIVAALGQV